MPWFRMEGGGPGGGQQSPPPQAAGGREAAGPGAVRMEELEFQPSWILVPVVIMVLFLLYMWLGNGSMTVKYKADVNDHAGHKKSFEFLHSLRRRGQLKQILSDDQTTEMMAMFLAEKHMNLMLVAEPWNCIECGKKAKKLITHPVAYLHLAQPMVIDMPGPVCGSRACESAHRKNFAEMMEEVNNSGRVPPSSGKRDL